MVVQNHITLIAVKMIALEKVLNNERISRALIGVNREEFDLLLNVFFQAYIYYEQSNKIDFVRGRKSILSQLEEKLFFILFYFKTYPTYDVLGIVFDMDRTTACKQVHLLSGLLLETVEQMDILPASERKELKKKLKNLNMREFVIADGTERPVRRPVNKDLQKEFYSGKKKRHTYKNLILTNKEKAILFLSETVSGKTHDMKIAKDTEFMKSIPKEIVCLFDSGFEGIDKIYQDAKISKPTKKKKGKELTKTQKKKNRSISKKRVLVENAIAGIKRFRITSDVFRNFKAGFTSIVIQIACAIWNLALRVKGLY